MVRSLIEEDVDMSKSMMLEEYEIESEGKGTSCKSSVRAKNSEATEEVKKKLERLKEELLVELKSQTGLQTSLRTSSLVMTHIQE